MKILVLTSRFPYPLEKGDKLRIFYQIKELSRHHDIILCSLSDKKISTEFIQELKPYCSEIHVFRLHKLQIYLQLIFYFLLGKPLQIAYFFNPIIKKKIEKIAYRIKPEHIYCQLIRMAEYTKDLNHIGKTLDYMDAFSMGMKRRADDSPFPFNWIFNQEAKRLRAYESQIFYDFDLHTIISEQDRNYIQNPSRDEILITPNGVDTQLFYFNDAEPKKYDLLFVGNMSYYPNIKAAEFLAFQILPLLKKQGVTMHLCIAGANPSTQVQELQSDNISVLGWVPKIEDIYHSAKIFVAPMFHGSGLQNKILEAMSAGVPVITSSQTNNAIKAQVVESILLADNAAEFAQKIIELTHNSESYRKQQLNARTFVEQNYSWQHFVKQLEEQIRKIELC